MNRITRDLVVLLAALSFLCSLKLSDSIDTIDTTQSIRDKETLVSAGGIFELGFFSPGSSNNWYVGIWYKNIPVSTVVWVANRETPLQNRTSGVLKVIQSGLLVLQDESMGNTTIWSSNTSSRVAQNPLVQLLDSGNLVLRDVNDDQPENYVWQSFDYPTDTTLPGMEFGWDYVNGIERYLSSWRTNDDPAPGEYTFHLDPTGYPQFITKRGNDTINRVGPWNGVTFSGTLNVGTDPRFKVDVIVSENGVYVRETTVDRSSITRLTLSPTGVLHRWAWVRQTQERVNILDIPMDNCDSYRLCGAYGICNIGKFPICGCLDKFVPRDLEGWTRTDWSSGCVRRTALNCEGGDGFVKYASIKLPDARNSWHNESMTLDECKVECLRNCSCMAYTNLDISRGGTGCLLYFGDLVDIRVLPAEGQDLYIRMASTELDEINRTAQNVTGSNGKRKQILIVSLTIVGIVLTGLGLLIYILKRKKNSTTGRRGNHERDNKDFELPFFHLSTLSKATNNFSMENRLGEGGYGPVYKGTLEDGQDIAVKRLSKTSKQGLGEFKNEVIFIAKLQHRNLVKLLGCCIEGEEQMLIYEYLPNKSLNLILFDQDNRISLDWSKRFQIVNGIARGIMYIHQDSRLRIIHRDLKASNILLDRDMNPKISDFGIAKRFRENETEDRTSQVVGTYGYMSPEYAVHGRFSVKSDVFSFGVLVLEIVSGKRNSEFSYRDSSLNLLGHAWTLYKEERSLELVDTCLYNSANLWEVLRVIHVGLLCVQQSSDDRPNMSSVVGMLSNHEIVLPQANCPGFFTESDAFSSQSTGRSTYSASSVNTVTITRQEGR